MSESKYLLKIIAKTWTKDVVDNKGVEKGLFDFETENVNRNEFEIRESCSFTRFGNNVHEIIDSDKFIESIMFKVNFSDCKFSILY